MKTGRMTIAVVEALAGRRVNVDLGVPHPSHVIGLVKSFLLVTVQTGVVMDLDDTTLAMIAVKLHVVREAEDGLLILHPSLPEEEGVGPAVLVVLPAFALGMIIQMKKAIDISVDVNAGEGGPRMMNSMETDGIEEGIGTDVKKAPQCESLTDPLRLNQQKWYERFYN